MKILCRIGLHKWSKFRFHHHARFKVKDWNKYCKRWVEKKNLDRAGVAVFSIATHLLLRQEITSYSLIERINEKRFL